jgi:hypothetical protein
MTYQPIENNGTSSSRLEANVAIFSSPTTPRSETSLARSSDSIGARHAFGRLPPAEEMLRPCERLFNVAVSSCHAASSSSR